MTQSQNQQQYNGVRCANCGQLGHIHKTCNHPTTSYGVICYRVMPDGQVRYLQIQRKDSLSYVEFLRGKYNHKNRNYVVQLLQNMTRDERRMLCEGTFPELWERLWQTDRGRRNYMREFNHAERQYNTLKAGYLLESRTGETRFVCLRELVERDCCDSPHTEPEWGFPKGRRSINESDFHCALREFREETGVAPQTLQLAHGSRSFEETFTGLNRTRYRHVYYVARLDDAAVADAVGVDPRNAAQAREVRRVAWFDYEAAQDNIRETNVERKELFKRVHNMITGQCGRMPAGCV